MIKNHVKILAGKFLTPARGAAPAAKDRTSQVRKKRSKKLSKKHSKKRSKWDPRILSQRAKSTDLRGFQKPL